MRLAKNVVLRERVDHERWRCVRGDTYDLCGEHNLVPFVESYDLGIDGRGRCVVFRTRKVPWTDATRQYLFGSSFVAWTPERIAKDPRVTPAKREILMRYLTPPAPHAHLTDLETHVEFWIRELKDAMKRHRVIWISSHLTRNCAAMRDVKGLCELIRVGRVVRSGKRVAFAWAVNAISNATLNTYEDDCDALPTTNLSCTKGDLEARVDAFVDAELVCNTMLRNETSWIPLRPWIKPRCTEIASRSRVWELQKKAEDEGALFVGDAVGCVVTLRQHRGVHVRREGKIITTCEGESFSLEEAQRALKTIRVRDYEHMLRALPANAKFKRAYALIGPETEDGWMRETQRFTNDLICIEIIST